MQQTEIDPAAKMAREELERGVRDITAFEVTGVTPDVAYTCRLAADI